MPHKVQRVFKGGAGDAGVDGRVQNLRQRADRGRALKRALKRDHVIAGDKHVVEHHRAAARGALAEEARAKGIRILTGSVGSWDNYRTEGDISGPLNDDGSVQAHTQVAEAF